MSERWTYQPLVYPWGVCQRCPADAVVAVFQGRVWRTTLCEACAEAYREEHRQQLDMFEED